MIRGTPELGSKKNLLSQIVAVVGGEDDQRVVPQARLLQGLHQLSDVFVDQGAFRHVVGSTGAQPL